ncbi:hypothetical protein D3C84_514440 [compost metagenome]
MELLDIGESDFIRQRAMMLAVTNALGVIDPGVSGHEVTGDTGNGRERSNLGPEQFHGHDDGCQWCISSTGKDCDKTDSSQHAEG